MDLRREITRRIDALAPAQQARVLQFVASLSDSAVKGENGAELRRFARLLDSDSAEQMIQAIEEGCERVDTGGW
ncbi:MAG TPA: hypothetical protein VG273_14840 [Bryobacteraceae bacterium]|jgi:hypothetical protein|nr:hypothetical protein [Bryobacteraceae bacterium]